MTLRDVDILAEQVLRTANIPPRPPIPLGQLAITLGVSEVVKKPMVEDGALIQMGDRAAILIRADRPRARQRFTLAHELAHLLLNDKRELAVEFREARRRRDSEEGLCDEIAAALLMPGRWILDRFHESSMTLATLRELGQLCDVSLSAALVRLDEVCNWTSALLRWRRESGKFRFTAAAGLPPGLFGQVGSSHSTHETFQGVSGRDRWMTVPISIRGEDRHVKAQVSVRAGTALALFDHNQLMSSQREERR